jgi:hypothetical protein
MPIKWPSRYNKSTNRRRQWQELKTRHAAAIKASKVSFGSDFGSAIDSFENEIKKVADVAFASKATLNDLDKVSQAGSKAQNIAEYYRSKLGTMQNPAKKELLDFLKDLESDAQIWQDSTLFEPQPYGQWKKLAWSAAPSLVGHLEIFIRHGTTAVQLLAQDPNFATADYLKSLKSQTDALLVAAKAAQPNAARIETLYNNAIANTTYLGVLKGETAKAMAGPFAALARNIQGFQAFCKADKAARVYIISEKRLDYKKFTSTFPMVTTDLQNLAKAEKELVL